MRPMIEAGKVRGVSYLEVDAGREGQRIDNFLTAHLKGVPRSHIYRLLRTGQVRVNKGRIQPTYRLKQGDVVLLEAMGGGFTWGSAILRW